MELTGSENRMSTSSSSSCTSTLSPFFIQVACKNYSSLVRSGAEVGSGKAWPSLLQDAGGRVAEAGEPAALPQDPSPLGTIPAPRLAPLSPGNTSIPYGGGFGEAHGASEDREELSASPTHPLAGGNVAQQRGTRERGTSPRHRFPHGYTRARLHRSSDVLTSGKSNDKVKIELCSLGVGGPAEVLSGTVS